MGIFFGCIGRSAGIFVNKRLNRIEVDFHCRVAAPVNLMFGSGNLYDAGIRVNSIQPGMTHSDLDKDLPEEAKKEAVESVPAHRFGEPIEIGALCVYLASPAGSQVRGVNYAHDGGLLCIN